MKTLLKYVLLLLLSPPVASADPLTDAMRVLEQEQMSLLARQQNRPGVVIDPFNSDGCSGGLSAAWSYLAEMLPEFRQRVGELPPWEHCCIEHDKSYWRGESRDGYAKRKQADQQLRACVRQTGRQQSEELAARLQQPAEQIEQMFDNAADMMYQAVRLGGGPCTGLPWRWGHGWPECEIFVDDIMPANP